MKSVKIDLPKRTEERYLTSSVKSFLSELSQHIERKKFSNTEYIQTVYLNNEQHVVPFEKSIKLRRYFDKPNVPFDTEGKFFLDLKEEKDGEKRKKRIETTLKEAVEIVNNEFGLFGDTGLRPYVMVEYLRHHYIPKNLEGIRLTVDKDLNYFYIYPSNSTEFLGKEDNYSRLEIKSLNNDENFDALVKDALIKSNALPSISKKFKAYGFLGLQLEKKYGKPFSKEIKNCEIESKLETDSEEIFHKVKNFFNSSRSQFNLPEHFPFTVESASVNRYYEDNGEILKAMFFSDNVELVRKSNLEFPSNIFGLNCITKRKEEKGEIISGNSELIKSLELKGELYRMRKAFWIEHPENNRFYHISLDCCIGSPGKLYQMEVEYTGTYSGSNNSNNKEKEIIEDVSLITESLLENFPELRPSQLTKQGWLGIK